jgi:hypothetical protein
MLEEVAGHGAQAHGQNPYLQRAVWAESAAKPAKASRGLAGPLSSDRPPESTHDPGRKLSWEGLAILRLDSSGTLRKLPRATSRALGGHLPKSAFPLLPSLRLKDLPDSLSHAEEPILLVAQSNFFHELTAGKAHPRAIHAFRPAPSHGYGHDHHRGGWQVE